MMCPQPELSVQEYSAEERSLLLKLAHDAISSVLIQSEISLESPTPHLAEPRGVFTTLYYGGDLRGCVGHVLATSPLYRTVAETARAAAFQDPRFNPVTADELPALQVSLSILSPLQPIQPEEVEIGKHGLLITASGRRGLLLPQVPEEHGWNCLQFLEQTCRKAGLPIDAWKEGASIEAFTAEIFADAKS
jgi:AmmeMemoRadiSam system protein A